MIDRICNSIPEWKNEEMTIKHIKTNIPCMLENIERVLEELLNQRNNNYMESINQIVSIFRRYNT